MADQIAERTGSTREEALAATRSQAVPLGRMGAPGRDRGRDRLPLLRAGVERHRRRLVGGRRRGPGDHLTRFLSFGAWPRSSTQSGARSAPATPASWWTRTASRSCCPSGWRSSTCRRFVDEKRPWIERTLRRFRQAEQALPAPELEHGTSVPYLGRELLLRVRVEPGRVRPYVGRRGDVLSVKVGGHGTEAVRDALERWYRRRARVEVASAPRRRHPPRRHELHEAHDPLAAHPLGQLLVARRDELQLAPAARAGGDPRLRGRARGRPPRGDGPLAALLELLASRCPDYRRHERWLRQNGPALRL